VTEGDRTICREPANIPITGLTSPVMNKKLLFDEWDGKKKIVTENTVHITRFHATRFHNTMTEQLSRSDLYRIW